MRDLACCLLLGLGLLSSGCVTEDDSGAAPEATPGLAGDDERSLVARESVLDLACADDCAAPDDSDAAVACGGRAGDTCGATEYCAFERDDVCGHTDAEGVCTPRPTECLDDNFQAVCGCDGVSYGSDCDAAMAGTGVLADGACAL